MQLFKNRPAAALRRRNDVEIEVREFCAPHLRRAAFCGIRCVRSEIHVFVQVEKNSKTQSMADDGSCQHFLGPGLEKCDDNNVDAFKTRLAASQILSQPSSVNTMTSGSFAEAVQNILVGD